MILLRETLSYNVMFTLCYGRTFKMKSKRYEFIEKTKDQLAKGGMVDLILVKNLKTNKYEVINVNENKDRVVTLINGSV